MLGIFVFYTLLKERPTVTGEYGWLISTGQQRVFTKKARGFFLSSGGLIKLNIQRSFRKFSNRPISLIIKCDGKTDKLLFIRNLELKRYVLKSSKRITYIEFEVSDSNSEEFVIVQTGLKKSPVRRAAHIVFILCLIILIIQTGISFFSHLREVGTISGISTYHGNLKHGIFELFLFLFIIFFFISEKNWIGTGGDEPDYLMMSSSIARDFDLNIRNNFLKKEYLDFKYITIGPLPGGVKNINQHYNRSIPVRICMDCNSARYFTLVAY